MHLEIENLEQLTEFVQEAKKAGFLKDLDISGLSEKQFPIRVPVNLGGVLKVAGNPIVRKTFGRKIEAAIAAYVGAMV